MKCWYAAGYRWTCLNLFLFLHSSVFFFLLLGKSYYNPNIGTSVLFCMFLSIVCPYLYFITNAIYLHVFLLHIHHSNVYVVFVTIPLGFHYN